LILIQFKFMKIQNFAKILYFIILLLSLNLDALAQNSTPKPDPMQRVLLGKGKVTQKEYDEFWQSLDAKNEQEKKVIINSMRKTYLPLQEYQKETWACVKKAWNLRKKVTCPKADAVAASFKKVNGFDFSQQMITMSHSLIEGAAKRKPAVIMKDAPAFPITAQSIAESESFFKNSLDRLDQVMRSKY